MEKNIKTSYKDPKRQEHCKKSHKTYTKRLKESILTENELSTPPSTDNSTSFIGISTPSTSSSIDNHPTTRSGDTYIYGVGIVAVLARGACVFFLITKNVLRQGIKNK